MVRARIFLTLAFLVATFLAAATMPDAGVAAQSDCPDFVCTGVAVGDGCPGCKDDGNRAAKPAAACAAMCAAMTAVLPVPTHIVRVASRSGEGPARSEPSGVAPAPERAPPRTSITA